MRKTKVKTKHVIGYPNEVINVLSDLIQKGEVNVVMFDQYREMFSPEKLESELSQRVNSLNGWECEYLYLVGKKEGLKYHRQGEEGVKDKDVWRYVWKNLTPHLYFPDEGIQVNISESVSDYVNDTVPELIEEGITKDVFFEDVDNVWDHVDKVVEYYLDDDTKKLFQSYWDRDDYTLYEYTGEVMYNLMEQEYEYCEDEC